MKTFHSGALKKSIVVKATPVKVWKKLSNIAGLEWAVGVKNCRFKTKTKRGVGAIRDITFEDGGRIEEHVVLWRDKESFSYIAVSGLPLRAYVATISIEKKNKGTKITWESYLNSQKMTKKQFDEFVAYMGVFYEESLSNLKLLLESK